MENNLCVNCGHDYQHHHVIFNDTPCNSCSCKKFKAVSVPQKSVQNHSPSDKAKPCDNHTEGNHSQDEPELLIEGKPATKKEVMKLFDEPDTPFNLSKWLMDFTLIKEDKVIAGTKVKEFIRVVDEDIDEFRNIAQHKHPEADLIVHLCSDIKEIIKRRAGKNLI